MHNNHIIYAMPSSRVYTILGAKHPLVGLSKLKPHYRTKQMNNEQALIRAMILADSSRNINMTT